MLMQQKHEVHSLKKLLVPNLAAITPKIYFEIMPLVYALLIRGRNIWSTRMSLPTRESINHSPNDITTQSVIRRQPKCDSLEAPFY